MRLTFISYDHEAKIFVFSIDQDPDPYDPFFMRATRINNNLAEIEEKSDLEVNVKKSYTYTAKNFLSLENYLLENKKKFFERGIKQSDWITFLNEIEKNTKIKISFKENINISADVALQEIGKFLDLASRVQYAITNKHLYKLMFGLTLQMNFPVIYNQLNLTAASGRDYQQAFVQEEKRQYSNLDTRQKNLMRAFREGNLQTIKSMKVTLKSLWLCEDGLNSGLSRCAYENKRQAVLDYCFQEIVLPDYKLENNEVDVIKKGVSDLTLFDWAIICFCSPDYLMSLLVKGADLAAKTRSWTVLEIAVAYNNFIALEFLLDVNGNKLEINTTDSNGNSPIICAANYNSLESLQCLIKYGADVNLRNRCTETPLFIAAKKNHLEILKLLIAHHADINIPKSNGQTPLYAAVENNHFEVMKYLVEHQAYVNQPMLDGTTPLFIAARNDYFEIAKYLVEHNANINQPRNDGETPLCIAVANNRLEMVKYLVEQKADINKSNSEGETPLYIAALFDHRLILGYLVEKGADLFIYKAESQDGALKIAWRNGHSNIALYLITQPKMIAKYIERKVNLPSELISLMEKRTKQLLETNKNAAPIFTAINFYFINKISLFFFKGSASTEELLCLHSLIEQFNDRPEKLHERVYELMQIGGLPEGFKAVLRNDLRRAANESFRLG